MPPIEIPSFGFGTGGIAEYETCADCVQQAIDQGYRLIDTAQSYENEEAVGEGIARASVPRDELFISTKVWTNLDQVIPSVHESLRKLGIDTLDMLYVHWPAGDYHPQQTMDEFNELYEDGYIRSIGVSNFTPGVLDQARSISKAPIAANQIEMHPLLQQEEMVRYAAVHDMYIVAYAPVAEGRVFDVSELSQIAEKHGVSEAQVSLAWLNSKPNVVPIPNSRNPDHIRENFESRELILDPEDIAAIESIEREERGYDQDRALW